MPTKMAVWHGNGLIRKETPHPLLFMVQHPFSVLLQYLPAQAVTTTVKADSGVLKRWVAAVDLGDRRAVVTSVDIQATEGLM